nr:11169_t:CDS:10 [Entrophospora candida]
MENVFENKENKIVKQKRSLSPKKQLQLQQQKKQKQIRAEKLIPITPRKLFVLSIEYSTYFEKNGKQNNEKMVHLLDPIKNIECFLHLRDFWYDTCVMECDCVNVIGEFDNENHCIADNSKTLVIVNPDLLLTATRVADSFSCLRKAILQDRVKANDSINPSAIIGILCHQLFQSCLSNQNFSTKFMEKKLQELVKHTTQKIYSANLQEEGVIAELRTIIPKFQSWAKTFVGNTPLNSIFTDVNNSTKVAISKVLNIEELIWSPNYGLKGMIDASLEAKVYTAAAELKTVVMPFELKTSKSSSLILNHRSQTLFYTLLMSDRYKVGVDSGLLYYPKSNDCATTGKMYAVNASHEDLKALVIRRNEVAYYAKNGQILPPMLKNEYVCKNCFVRSSCLLYHKAVEKGNEETSGLGMFFKQETGHLNNKYSKFFGKWDNIIHKEDMETDAVYVRQHIWNKPAIEREIVGQCLTDMKLELESVIDNSKSEESRKFRCKFTKYNNNSKDENIHKLHRRHRHNNRNDNNENEIAINPIMSSQFCVGDSVVVSSEKDKQYALALGNVYSLSSDAIWLSLDRVPFNGIRHEEDFDIESCHTFVSSLNSSSSNSSGDDDKYNSTITTTFRIDRDESTLSISLMIRQNLVKLLMNVENTHLRRLVVDGILPKFDDNSEEINCFVESGKLNDNQKKAMKLALNDYALILGMPGTGKTTIIVEIIKALVAMNKSVLITAYTHTAIDHILLKLVDEGIDILRLGSREKVKPELRNYTFDNLAFESVRKLDEIIQSKKVVAITCLGANHWIFKKKQFDYCIVDEASQMILPVCIGPLFNAKRFLLVGDNYQLAPIIRDNKQGTERVEEATSLFRTLRLEIPNWNSNFLDEFHNDNNINNVNNISCSINGEKNCWLRNVLDPERPVIFVDTDIIDGDGNNGSPKEEVVGSQITNNFEVQLISLTIKALLAGGVPAKSIGVISIYRSQMRLIKCLLGDKQDDIEVSTVDKYQGRDKACILVSFVRSNSKEMVGELLTDFRRLNVALTRAESKLILFGSCNTLNKTPLLRTIISFMEEKNWIIKNQICYEISINYKDQSCRKNIDKISNLNKTPESEYKRLNNALPLECGEDFIKLEYSFDIPSAELVG